MKLPTFLVTVLVVGATSSAHAQSTFPDVPDNHWAAQAVKRLAELGIIEGFPAAPPRFNQTDKAKTSAAKTKVKAPAKAPAKARTKAIKR